MHVATASTRVMRMVTAGSEGGPCFMVGELSPNCCRRTVNKNEQVW